MHSLRELRHERLFVSRLISKDGRTASIAVRFREAYYDDSYRKEILAFVEATFAPFRARPEQTLLLSGSVPTREAYTRFVQRDSRVFFPAIFVLLALALWTVFRRVTWAVLPILALGLTLQFTFAAMQLLDRPISLLTSAIPVVVILVGVADTIHLLTRYQDRVAGLSFGAPGAHNDRRQPVTADVALAFMGVAGLELRIPPVSFSPSRMASPSTIRFTS